MTRIQLIPRSGLLCGALFGLLGCGQAASDPASDSDDDDRSNGSGGGAYVPPDPEPLCVSGSECECGEYSPGFTVCVDGVESCDCSTCDALIPTSEEVPPFSACGGNPVGDWELVATDTRGSRFALTVNSSNGTSTIRCPAELNWRDGHPTSHFRLNADGSAEVWATSAPVVSRFQSSCTLDFCEELTGAGSCEEDACGFCTCENSLNGYSESAARWEVQATDLAIFWDAGIAPPGEPFCVSGDQLLLQFAGSEVWTYRRVQAPVECPVTDWNVEPGCAAPAVGAAPTTQCVDAETAPASCAELNSTECNTTPGCQPAGDCTGTPNDCGDYSLGCEYYGCTPGADEYTSCTGDVTCESLNDSTQCGGFGCDWAFCGGVWEACSTLSAEDCEGAAHCVVVDL